MGQDMIIPETSKKKYKKLRSGELRSIVIRQQESKVERHDMSLLCRYVIIRSTVWLDDYCYHSML